MKSSLKTKLTMSFTVIILFTGLISASVGTYFINEYVINQVQERVRNDLNTADEILKTRIEHIKNNIYYATFRDEIKNALQRRDCKRLKILLEEVRENGDLEILTITDKNGNVILRSGNPGVSGDSQIFDQLTSRVIAYRHLTASPVIIKIDELEKEGKEFANRARIQPIDTPKSRPKDAGMINSGMMLKAAAPVWGNNGELIGIIYGGNLINHNNDLVDKIKNTVYRYEKYRGRDIGNATIFQGDVRIATNVMTEDGKRAIGTRVSGEVYDRVLSKGEQWVGRAFVVNSWHITAYGPIRDIDNNIIGMLYVGILQDKFIDMRNRTILGLFGITVAGMLLVLIVSNILANAIINPIKYLVRASKRISNGDFLVKIDVKSKDEVGELENAYKKMAAALQDRDEKLKQAMKRLEDLSRTDALTGVLNRRAFSDLSQLEIDRAKRYKHPISIAYLDLDNFKEINDTLGHGTGDNLLCAVSAIIKSNIREIDIFARLGGDEFILLLTKTETAAAYEILSKLQKLLLEEMGRNSWAVTFSIGLITFYNPPDNIEEMVKRADDLMYIAKQSGKNMIKHSTV